MSTLKKSFLQKCRDFIGSSKKGKKKKTQPQPKILTDVWFHFITLLKLRHIRICSFMILFYFGVVHMY